MFISKLAVYASLNPWKAVPRLDAVTEVLFLRHIAPASGHAPGLATRSFDAALGGYRQRHLLCLGPALHRG
jgi:hypothetical protein